MMDFDFFTFLWIALALCALSSFAVFFAKKISTAMLGSAFFLLGVTVQLNAISSFSSSTLGQVCAIELWGIWALLCIGYVTVLKQGAGRKALPKLFFLLPFVAFITVAISLDLVTLLLGLGLFHVAFVLLKASKKHTMEQLAKAVQQGLVAFSSYAYGVAILLSREGVLNLSRLNLKLSISTWDAWTTLGFGLLVLSVVIYLYSILPLVKNKKNGKV